MESTRTDGFSAAQNIVGRSSCTYLPGPLFPQYFQDTNVNNEAAGAVLSQMVGGEECVVAYYSKTFSLP